MLHQCNGDRMMKEQDTAELEITKELIYSSALFHVASHLHLEMELKTTDFLGRPVIWRLFHIWCLSACFSTGLWTL